MKKELYIENLFWFNQYKRECGKYIALHKKYISEFGSMKVAYFIAMRPQSDKVFDLSEKVLIEIKDAIETMKARKIGEYLSIIQEFLDYIYDGMDFEYASRDSNGMDLAFPRGVPSIQNYIRAEYVKINGKEKEVKDSECVHFKELLNRPDDLEFYLNALRTKKPTPVIDDKNKYLLGGRKKSAVGAWVQALRDLGHFKDDVTTKQIADLLHTVIGDGFEIEERSLNNKGSLVYQDYSPAIKSRLTR